jgi:hypothetical protein
LVNTNVWYKNKSFTKQGSTVSLIVLFKILFLSVYFILYKT